MAFCDNLRRKREEHGLTQADLAEKMNVTQALVSFWELGRNFPEASKLPKLSQVLDCTVDELFQEGQPQ